MALNRHNALKFLLFGDEQEEAVEEEFVPVSVEDIMKQMQATEEQPENDEFEGLVPEVARAYGKVVDFGRKFVAGGRSKDIFEESEDNLIMLNELDKATGKEDSGILDRAISEASPTRFGKSAFALQQLKSLKAQQVRDKLAAGEDPEALRAEILNPIQEDLDKLNASLTKSILEGPKPTASMNKLMDNPEGLTKEDVQSVLSDFQNVVDLFAESAVPSLGIAAAGLGGGLLAGPPGAAFGAFLASKNVEERFSLMEAMIDSGVDLSSAEAVMEFMKDRDKVDEILSSAEKRGVGVGIFDAAALISGGLLIDKTAQALKQIERYGKLRRAFLKNNKTAYATAFVGDMGIQSLAGGLGEIFGSTLAGEEIDGAAVFLEMYGEITSGGLTDITAGMILRRMKKKVEDSRDGEPMTIDEIEILGAAVARAQELRRSVDGADPATTEEAQQEEVEEEQHPFFSEESQAELAREINQNTRDSEKAARDDDDIPPNVGGAGVLKEGETEERDLQNKFTRDVDNEAALEEELSPVDEVLDVDDEHVPPQTDTSSLVQTVPLPKKVSEQDLLDFSDRDRDEREAQETGDFLDPVQAELNKQAEEEEQLQGEPTPDELAIQEAIAWQKARKKALANAKARTDELKRIEDKNLPPEPEPSKDSVDMETAAEVAQEVLNNEEDSNGLVAAINTSLQKARDGRKWEASPTADPDVVEISQTKGTGVKFKFNAKDGTSTADDSTSISGDKTKKDALNSRAGLSRLVKRGANEYLGKGEGKTRKKGRKAKTDPKIKSRSGPAPSIQQAVNEALLDYDSKINELHSLRNQANNAVKELLDTKEDVGKDGTTTEGEIARLTKLETQYNKAKQAFDKLFFELSEGTGDIGVRESLTGGEMAAREAGSDAMNRPLPTREQIAAKERGRQAKTAANIARNTEGETLLIHEIGVLPGEAKAEVVTLMQKADRDALRANTIGTAVASQVLADGTIRIVKIAVDLATNTYKATVLRGDQSVTVGTDFVFNPENKVKMVLGEKASLEEAERALADADKKREGQSRANAQAAKRLDDQTAEKQGTKRDRTSLKVAKDTEATALAQVNEAADALFDATRAANADPKNKELQTKKRELLRELENTRAIHDRAQQHLIETLQIHQGRESTRSVESFRAEDKREGTNFKEEFGEWLAAAVSRRSPFLADAELADTAKQVLVGIVVGIGNKLNKIPMTRTSTASVSIEDKARRELARELLPLTTVPLYKLMTTGQLFGVAKGLGLQVDKGTPGHVIAARIKDTAAVLAYGAHPREPMVSIPLGTFESTEIDLARNQSPDPDTAVSLTQKLEAEGVLPQPETVPASGEFADGNIIVPITLAQTKEAAVKLLAKSRAEVAVLLKDSEASAALYELYGLHTPEEQTLSNVIEIASERAEISQVEEERTTSTLPNVPQALQGGSKRLYDMLQLQLGMTPEVATSTLRRLLGQVPEIPVPSSLQTIEADLGTSSIDILASRMAEIQVARQAENRATVLGEAVAQAREEFAQTPRFLEERGDGTLGINELERDSEPANPVPTPGLGEIEGTLTLESTAKKAKPTVFTNEAAKEAKARLKGKLHDKTMMFDPSQLKDVAIVAGNLIETKAIDFKQFSKEMVKRFGEEIKPYLQTLWNDAVRKVNGIEDVPLDLVDDNEVTSANIDKALGKYNEPETEADLEVVLSGDLPFKSRMGQRRLVEAKALEEESEWWLPIMASRVGNAVLEGTPGFIKKPIIGAKAALGWLVSSSGSVQGKLGDTVRDIRSRGFGNVNHDRLIISGLSANLQNALIDEGITDRDQINRINIAAEMVLADPGIRANAEAELKVKIPDSFLRIAMRANAAKNRLVMAGVLRDSFPININTILKGNPSRINAWLHKSLNKSGFLTRNIPGTIEQKSLLERLSEPARELVFKYAHAAYDLPTDMSQLEFVPTEVLRRAIGIMGIVSDQGVSRSTSSKRAGKPTLGKRTYVDKNGELAKKKNGDPKLTETLVEEATHRQLVEYIREVGYDNTRVEGMIHTIMENLLKVEEADSIGIRSSGTDSSITKARGFLLTQSQQIKSIVNSIENDANISDEIKKAFKEEYKNMEPMTRGQFVETFRGKDPVLVDLVARSDMELALHDVLRREMGETTNIGAMLTDSVTRASATLNMTRTMNQIIRHGIESGEAAFITDRDETKHTRAIDESIRRVRPLKRMQVIPGFAELSYHMVDPEGNTMLNKEGQPIVRIVREGGQPTLYGTPRFVRGIQDIMNVTATQHKGGALQALMALNALTKYDKVVANLPAHPRNLLGSLDLAIGKGLFPFIPGIRKVTGRGAVKFGIQAAFNAMFGALSDKSALKAARDRVNTPALETARALAARLNVSHDAAREGAMNDLLLHIFMADSEDFNMLIAGETFFVKNEEDKLEGMMTFLARKGDMALSRTNEILGTAFRLEDEAVKFMSWLQRAKQYLALLGDGTLSPDGEGSSLIPRKETSELLAKFFDPDRKRELTTEQLDTIEYALELGAQVTRNTFPTFSHASPGIRALSRFLFLGSFPTFSYEVGRGLVNHLGYAKGLIFGVLPDGTKVPQEARGRASGLGMALIAQQAAWFAAKTGLIGTMNALMIRHGEGQDAPDDEEDRENKAGFLGHMAASQLKGFLKGTSLQDTDSIIKAISPSYMQNNLLMIMPGGINAEKGTIEVINMGRSFAEGAFMEAFSNSIRNFNKLKDKTDVSDEAKHRIVTATMIAAFKPILDIFLTEEVLLGDYLKLLEQRDGKIAHEDASAKTALQTWANQEMRAFFKGEANPLIDSTLSEGGAEDMAAAALTAIPSNVPGTTMLNSLAAGYKLLFEEPAVAETTEEYLSKIAAATTKAGLGIQTNTIDYKIDFTEKLKFELLPRLQRTRIAAEAELFNPYVDMTKAEFESAWSAFNQTRADVVTTISQGFKFGIEVMDIGSTPQGEDNYIKEMLSGASDGRSFNIREGHDQSALVDDRYQPIRYLSDATKETLTKTWEEAGKDVNVLTLRMTWMENAQDKVFAHGREDDD
jgi:hypothetical protein